MEFDLAGVIRAVAATVPDRPAILQGDRRTTYADLQERTNRLANLLVSRGLGAHTDRARLAGWESGQDHLAVYLHNGPEYLEAMVGAFKARVAPFNVNYRYVAEELRYLLTDARARGVVFHSAFAPRLDEVRSDVDGLDHLLQVPDDSGIGLLDGACWYEEALAGASAAPPPVEPSPDDLYILYTGGTTGMPKGVLWRQGDVFPAALGGRQRVSGEPWPDLDAIVEVAREGNVRFLPAPPFMHGAAQWLGLGGLTMGQTLVLPRPSAGLEPAQVWSALARHRANVLLIVGDAFARPLLDELDRAEAAGTPHDLSSLSMVVSGGAPLSPAVKASLLARHPDLGILDGLGASETGQQATQFTSAGSSAPRTFSPGPGMCLASADLTRLVGSDEVLDEPGWLAQRGDVPLGYLGDEARTRQTFPVIDGVRCSIPGDRARFGPDGRLELLGRDSATINSGGEKIFAEEVEAAVALHPGVYDVVVTARPSDRWGEEVVAVVQRRDDEEASTLTADDILATAAEHIARFKLPKAVIFVPRVERSPTGKADLRWAAAVAAGDGP